MDTFGRVRLDRRLDPPIESHSTVLVSFSNSREVYV